jgi:hypothetical protein
MLCASHFAFDADEVTNSDERQVLSFVKDPT